MNITVAHVQGGEITGTIDESIRHEVTKLSHIHFPATNDALYNIIRMGEDSRYVFNVGCPATDLLLRVDTQLRNEARLGIELANPKSRTKYVQL
jgi:UDP-N-acetylglucosamine 2-epimerase (non-hydrolysing)/GDP/UDP-N,N'-diacetylbacillosamine 2-epimerase (hydrolysing)